jgi:transposase
MFFETKNLRIFIYGEVIDMRCGFEKLHYFTKEVMHQDVNQGHLYLFFGKNRRRLKALFYDGTGLVQISKRIERGKFMSRVELGEISEITFLEFKQVFNGGLVVRPRVERSIFVNKTMTQMGLSLQAGFNQSNLNHA